MTTGRAGSFSYCFARHLPLNKLLVALNARAKLLGNKITVFKKLLAVQFCLFCPTQKQSWSWRDLQWFEAIDSVRNIAGPTT